MPLTRLLPAAGRRLSTASARHAEVLSGSLGAQGESSRLSFEETARKENVRQDAVRTGRAGLLRTTRHEIETPAYVSKHPGEFFRDSYVQARGGDVSRPLFCEAVAFEINPGVDAVTNHGGLHGLLGRSGMIFTEGGSERLAMLLSAQSGDPNRGRENGQRLDRVLSCSEKGVKFANGANGQSYTLSPEHSIELQASLSADIISSLAFCSAASDAASLKRDVDRSIRWQERCLAAHQQCTSSQAIYGCLYFRGKSRDAVEAQCDEARAIGSMAFDGYILYVADNEDLQTLISELLPHLPAKRPRHLRGVSSIEGIQQAIWGGIDTFDGGFPHKLARQDKMLSRSGLIDLKDGKIERVLEAADAEWGETSFSLSYMHHLVKCYEPLAKMLCTTHNLRFVEQFISEIRSKLINT